MQLIVFKSFDIDGLDEPSSPYALLLVKRLVRPPVPQNGNYPLKCAGSPIEIIGKCHFFITFVWEIITFESGVLVTSHSTN